MSTQKTEDYLCLNSKSYDKTIKEGCTYKGSQAGGSSNFMYIFLREEGIYGDGALCSAEDFILDPEEVS